MNTCYIIKTNLCPLILIISNHTIYNICMFISGFIWNKYFKRRKEVQIHDKKVPNLAPSSSTHHQSILDKDLDANQFQYGLNSPGIHVIRHCFHYPFFPSLLSRKYGLKLDAEIGHIAHDNEMIICLSLINLVRKEC